MPLGAIEVGTQYLSGCSKPALGAVFADARAGAVVAAVGDERPAVVAAGLDRRLISSPPCGPCSLSHSSPVAGCDRRALHVAVAAGSRSRAARPARPTNGLSAGTLPSGSMRTTLPRWLSSVCASSLRAKRSPSVDEQAAVAREHQPRAAVQRCSTPWAAGGRSTSHVGQRVAVASRPRATAVLLPPSAARRLGVAPVDEVVVGELRVERHVEQAALATGDDRRQAGQRRAEAAVGADDAQASRHAR